MHRLLLLLLGFPAMAAMLQAAEIPTVPVTASSTHDPRYLPEYALDGKPDTRWASLPNRGEPEWLRIDFGSTVRVDEMTIVWEYAHATDYFIRVSDDGAEWTVVHRQTGSQGGRETLAGLQASGRFLEIYCTALNTFALASIWEVEFADADLMAAARAAAAATPSARRQAQLAQRDDAARRVLAAGVEKVVFAARENGTDGHWYANFSYYAQNTDRKCYQAGGRLCVLDIRTGEVTEIVSDPGGSVRDPAVHYDGKTIVYSRRREGADTFHLYAIGADGTGEVQLTDGPYDDIEPCWLPDGGIMFVSSRCKRWVNCWLTQVGVLYRCESDGSGIRQLSANVEHDNTPWVLPDGRILYQRWEYVDRSQVHYHHLWTTNPDGTGQMVYFGNLYPGNVFIDAKPVPGTSEVLLIRSPGHGANEHAGHVALVTPEMGPDHPPALHDISGMGFRDPFPLTRDTFLVAEGNRLFVMARNGEMFLLHELPAEWGAAQLHEPRPITPAARERVIAPRVRPTEATGTLVLSDVYRGRNMEGVARGDVRSLLVLESLPKPINYTGGMEPLTYGGSFTLERVVGKVPVAEDGSASFRLPANRAFFFVALDEQDRSIKRMQSFTSVAPGEVTGCVGCHESRTEAPRNLAGRGGAPAATAAEPALPEPVAGVPDVFDYPRDIQPVLDSHCVTCHNPDKRSGGVLLTGDRGPMFSHSYFSLAARRQVADGRNLPQSNYGPRAIGDSASPLMAKLEGEHHDVRATPAEVRVVRYWINAGAPWIGTYAGLGTGMIGGYEENQIDRSDLAMPAVKAAADVLEKRCMSCHRDPRTPLPTSPTDNLGMPPWAVDYRSPKLRYSRHIIYNLSRPEKSALLLAPLAREAGGWGMQPRDKDGKPEGDHIAVFADTNDPGYRALLASVEAVKERLETIGRFDMPNFTPRAEYLREMTRYGVLSPDREGKVDVYAADRAYWDLFVYRPETTPDAKPSGDAGH